MLTNIMTMARRQPVMMPSRPPVSQIVNIAIWPSGKVEPALRDDSLTAAGAIPVTFEQFEEVALKLKRDVLSGKLVPGEEDEIPKLTYNTFAKGKS